MGRIYPSGWKILDKKGGEREEQAVQPFRYPVCNEKSDGGAAEESVPPGMVCGGWGIVPRKGFSAEG